MSSPSVSKQNIRHSSKISCVQSRVSLRTQKHDILLVDEILHHLGAINYCIS